VNQIEIKTRDGICRSFVYRPAGGGPWPGVLVFMDGLAIRPAMLELGERLAPAGRRGLDRGRSALHARVDAAARAAHGDGAHK